MVRLFLGVSKESFFFFSFALAWRYILRREGMESKACHRQNSNLNLPQVHHRSIWPLHHSSDKFFMGEKILHEEVKAVCTVTARCSVSLNYQVLRFSLDQCHGHYRANRSCAPLSIIERITQPVYCNTVQHTGTGKRERDRKQFLMICAVKWKCVYV